MPGSRVRRVLSAVAAVCFTLGAVSWGGMPGCGELSASHRHSGGHQHGQAPPTQGCVVHLCCAHLSPGAPVALAAERLGQMRAHTGFAAASAVFAHRPAHALPFAQAPPRRTV